MMKTEIIGKGDLTRNQSATRGSEIETCLLQQSQFESVYRAINMEKVSRARLKLYEAHE